jgi:hypothetical protein
LQKAQAISSGDADAGAVGTIGHHHGFPSGPILIIDSRELFRDFSASARSESGSRTGKELS